MGIQRLLAVVAVLAAILCRTGMGHAQQVSEDPPTEPILRVETGPQHGAIINRIDTDAENRFAVTVSWDKTVRVWSLPDGRLKQVVWLPADLAKIGKAHAVAITPDGMTVAVGCCSGSRSHNNIFLFNRVSGELATRLPDLPGGVLHLAYSPDGKRLAASLEGANGIRVFDVGKGYRLLPSDTKYAKSSYWATFDRAGRLVTTSDDGFVRLYAVDHFAAPLHQFNLKDREPYAAAFSPDGTRVAVGYYKPTTVVVLSGLNLTKLFEADTAGSGYDNLKAVAWSQDGRFLFAGGEWSGHSGWNQVRRWDKGGRGAVDIPVEDISIMEIVGLNSGSMLFLHEDGFGLIGPDTKVHQLQQSLSRLNLQSHGLGPLRVSADGSTVQVEAYQPRQVYRFALEKRQVDINPEEDSALLGPITHDVPGLVVRNWKDSPTPTVNGARITLDNDEYALSVALVPNAQRFVLGANWSVRLLDQRGHENWARDVPGDGWHVNVTADGRLLVVAYGDGTIHWLRLADGTELLALFIHPDGKRWVAWTPQGYYDASVGGDELIVWQVNHGYDHMPNFFHAGKFRGRFNRPDVIRRVLQTLDVEEAVRAANQEAGRPTNETAVSVSSHFLPDVPVVKIIGRKEQLVTGTELQLAYWVRLPSPNESVHVEVDVDGVKVEEDHPSGQGEERVGELRISIPRHNCKVSILARNAKGPSEADSIDVQWGGTGIDPQPKLYVLAIGISKYKDKSVGDLQFAAKDASDFAEWAQTQEGRRYEKVIKHPLKGSLRDNEATRAAILEELGWITQAITNSNDIAMVFLAGHGRSTPGQGYYFLPYDYDQAQTASTAIWDEDLQRSLRKIGGKKIFFFDTCHSGAVIVDKFVNGLTAPENGVVVFASSTANEVSRERLEWNHGAFTKAVLDGLRGEAAPPNDTLITENELDDYVTKTVSKLTDYNQHAAMAKPSTVADFPIAERLP